MAFMPKTLRRDDGKARSTVPIPKLKKCRACKEPFLAMRSMQAVCSGVCAAVVAIAKRQKAEQAKEKAERKADKAKREAMKSRGQWLREAQTAFNKFIRLRDVALACVSCGRHHEGKWNAGHYLSVGARPELRFCETNVHKQCEPCNSYLSGNIALYRPELIRRVGLAEVDRLEGPHEPKKYSVDELIEIIRTYRRRARELEAATA